MFHPAAFDNDSPVEFFMQVWSIKYPVHPIGPQDAAPATNELPGTNGEEPLLRGAGSAGLGPSFNNVSMMLRHCCNHPWLLTEVSGDRLQSRAHAHQLHHAEVHSQVHAHRRQC